MYKLKFVLRDDLGKLFLTKSQAGVTSLRGRTALKTMGITMNQDNLMDQNDELPAEIDFSKGTRGKFYHPDAKLNLPIYLDEEVQRYLAAIASRRESLFPMSPMIYSRKISP